MKKSRLAIIDHEKCRPKKCNQECRRKCPPNIQGSLCIEIENTAIINEDLCIGCGMCVKVCPFNAIQIINLPIELDKPLYTYDKNSFRLYKLPYPKIGKVYGIIGENGIGKSTLLGILSNQIKPNFGCFADKNIITDDDIKKNVRGTELQTYFDKLYDGQLTVKMKPQNIEKVQRKYKNNTIMTILKKIYDYKNDYHDEIIDKLELTHLLNSDIGTLSGGEMQRFICGAILMQNADVYIFDEPTNYLDIKHRLAVSDLIRKKLTDKNYIFLVEHDMSILDYTSDIISIMYGVCGAYGVISKPYNTAEAINMFFGGYIAAENMRFRKESYNFKNHLMLEYEEELDKQVGLSYNENIIKTNDNKFKLIIPEGILSSDTAMVLMVGENGTGKTTFLNNLTKELNLSISYKKQYIDVSKYGEATVQDVLYNNIKKAMCSEMFISDVIRPFRLKSLYDKEISKLSGGELQRVAIAMCLGEDSDIYLIDEPSACLDIEQRVLATKIIKRFLIHNSKIGFIVEHDVMMVMAMGIENSSKIIVFEEIDNDGVTRTCQTTQPMQFHDGINQFLKGMNITFRTDPKLKRPRINKAGSQKDMEQKEMGKYYV